MFVVTGFFLNDAVMCPLEVHSTALVGGSIGTALLSVVLTHQLTSAIPASDGSGLAAAHSVPAAEQAQIAPAVADAFGNTFWWAAGIIALATIPALMLPRHKPQAPAAPGLM